MLAALLAKETLDEREILEVTGLPPAPALETRPLPVAGATQEVAGEDAVVRV
jgi:cell division protease FtsH